MRPLTNQYFLEESKTCREICIFFLHILVKFVVSSICFICKYEKHPVSIFRQSVSNKGLLPYFFHMLTILQIHHHVKSDVLITLLVVKMFLPDSLQILQSTTK